MMEAQSVSVLAVVAKHAQLVLSLLDVFLRTFLARSLFSKTVTLVTHLNPYNNKTYLVFGLGSKSCHGNFYGLFSTYIPQISVSMHNCHLHIMYIPCCKDSRQSLLTN